VAGERVGDGEAEPSPIRRRVAAPEASGQVDKPLGRYGRATVQDGEAPRTVDTDDHGLVGRAMDESILDEVAHHDGEGVDIDGAQDPGPGRDPERDALVVLALSRQFVDDQPQDRHEVGRLGGEPHPRLGPGQLAELSRQTREAMQRLLDAPGALACRAVGKLGDQPLRLRQGASDRRPQLMRAVGRELALRLERGAQPAEKIVDRGRDAGRFLGECRASSGADSCRSVPRSPRAPTAPAPAARSARWRMLGHQGEDRQEERHRALGHRFGPVTAGVGDLEEHGAAAPSEV
jgi:hypothetical protein